MITSSGDIEILENIQVWKTFKVAHLKYLRDFSTVLYSSLKNQYGTTMRVSIVAVLEGYGHGG